MAKDLKPTEALTLTQFWGGKDRGMCLQLTQHLHLSYLRSRWMFVQLTKSEAEELARALLEWTADARPDATDTEESVT